MSSSFWKRKSEGHESESRSTKQTSHQQRGSLVKQKPPGQSKSDPREVVRSRLRSSTDYKCVPELTADLPPKSKLSTFAASLRALKTKKVLIRKLHRPKAQTPSSKRRARLSTKTPKQKIKSTTLVSDERKPVGRPKKLEQNSNLDLQVDYNLTDRRSTADEVARVQQYEYPISLSPQHPRRDLFSPGAQTPASIDRPIKRGRGRPRKSSTIPTQHRRTSNFAVSTPCRILQVGRRVSLFHTRDEFTSHLGSSAKTPKATGCLHEPETPTRNQTDHHNCAVCKEQTCLPSAEYEESIRKGEAKALEPGPDELTSTEDPALFCVKCTKPFHLTCVYDEFQLQNWATEHPTKFYCQQCIRCTKCDDPIFDPGNVQCVSCGMAFHETCKPTTRMTHDFPALSRVWFCQVCEKKIIGSSNQLKDDLSNSRNPTNTKAEIEPVDDPIVREKSKKQEERVKETPKLSRDPRTGRFSAAHSAAIRGLKSRVSLPDKPPGTPKSRRSRISEPERTSSNAKSPSASPRTTRTFPSKSEISPKTEKAKDPMDEEAQRLAFLSKLKEGLRYKGEFHCVAAQESTFCRLNEEHVVEEEDPSTTEIHHYLPFASVGAKTASEEPNDYQFNYGDICYKPRFYNFLRSRFASFHRLSFCHNCLMPHGSMDGLTEHFAACLVTNPPGSIVYQEANLTVWEVSGQKEKVYARRLSLFAKTFIGSKTVYFEVEQFMFYILTETDGRTNTLAGYFSKEIKPTANNNLSCLLILPWMQRKGYGVFLIDLSYQLSLRERKIGSPEHPLSDAGLKTYRQYWFAAIMSYVREKLYNNEQLDLVGIKEHTGIEIRDIIETMIVADMTFILDDKLQINVETPFYTTLSSLRRRYVKSRLLKLSTQPLIGSPFTTYN